MLPALLPALMPIVGDVVKSVFPDPEAENKAKAALMQLASEGKLREFEASMEIMKAEAKSSDPYTSRARPSLFYVMYGVITLCFVGGILGVWWPDQVAQAAINISNLLEAIPEELWWLFATGYLGYSGARTYEKSKIIQAKRH